jgi:hypothetical protein
MYFVHIVSFDIFVCGNVGLEFNVVTMIVVSTKIKVHDNFSRIMNSYIKTKHSCKYI